MPTILALFFAAITLVSAPAFAEDYSNPRDQAYALSAEISEYLMRLHIACVKLDPEGYLSDNSIIPNHQRANRALDYGDRRTESARRWRSKMAALGDSDSDRFLRAQYRDQMMSELREARDSYSRALWLARLAKRFIDEGVQVLCNLPERD